MGLTALYRKLLIQLLSLSLFPLSCSYPSIIRVRVDINITKITSRWPKFRRCTKNGNRKWYLSAQLIWYHLWPEFIILFVYIKLIFHNFIFSCFIKCSCIVKNKQEHMLFKSLLVSIWGISRLKNIFYCPVHTMCNNLAISLMKRRLWTKSCFSKFGFGLMLKSASLQKK